LSYGTIGDTLKHGEDGSKNRALSLNIVFKPMSMKASVYGLSHIKIYILLNHQSNKILKYL